MNYGNRNATSGQTGADIAKGYLAAVTSAVGMSLGLRALFGAALAGATGTRKFVLTNLINWAAIGSAGVANITCMRMAEMQKGIKVYDRDHNELGVSVAAAKSAVGQTAFSRFALSTQLMFMPMITYMGLERVGLMPRGKIIKSVLDLTVVGFALYFSLPVALASFPQEGSLDVSAAEPEFRELKTESGELIKTLYFNKGL